MEVIPRLIRYTRRAAAHAGLISRGYEALAADVSALIDGLAPELMKEHRIPGLSVLVTLANGARVERIFGCADAATGEPLTPDTLFQVMSITKPVTAFGAVRLAETGRVDLDAPVTRYLRSWSLPLERRGGHDFEGVTLRRLLSHSAGFNIRGFGWVPPGAPTPSPAQLLDGIEGPEMIARLEQAPGEQLLYSGAGYTLVQLVIEDVTGRPFADFMRDEVFAPLGMNSTSYVAHACENAPIVTRHDAMGNALPPAVCASAGPTGLYSTPRDLSRLWCAMFTGPGGEPAGRDLISPASARAMTTPQTDRAAKRVCGLGFFLWLKRSDTVFSHSGFKEGCWSQVDGMLKRRAVIAACCNGDAGKGCVAELCTRVRQLLFDRAI